MDNTFFGKNVVKDILYILISYEPSIPYCMDESLLAQIDWRILIKIVFNLEYPHGTNISIMESYNNYYNRKNRNLYVKGRQCDQLRINSEEKSLNHIEEINPGRYELMVKFSDGTLGSISRYDGEKRHESKIFFKKIDFGVKIEKIFGIYLLDLIKLSDGRIIIYHGLNYKFQYSSEFLEYDLQYSGNFTEIKIPEIKNFNADIEEIMVNDTNIIIKLTNNRIIIYGKESYSKFLVNVHGYPEDYDSYINNYTNMLTFPQEIAEIIHSKYAMIIKLIDGTLFGYGYNIYGQLGLKDKMILELEEIKGLPKNIVEISSSEHTIIRLSDGILMACGNNTAGQLGLGDHNRRNKFEEIKGVPRNVVDIIINGDMTIIRLSYGTLMGCGSNIDGQLGFGATIKRLNKFTEMVGIPKNIKTIVNINKSTYILFTDGTLMVSGRNYYGQLGLGDKENKYIFERVAVLNIKEILDINNIIYLKLRDDTLMTISDRYCHELEKTRFNVVKYDI